VKNDFILDNFADWLVQAILLQIMGNNCWFKEVSGVYGSLSRGLADAKLFNGQVGRIEDEF
jgi:hypothetical protein